MIRTKIFVIILTLAPLITMAQKAYETVNYNGKINAQTIAFKLANGYIGASEVSLSSSPKAKPVVYLPDSGVPDSDNKLTFKNEKVAHRYFIMNDMQEAYDRPPAIIYGIFISGNKSVQIKLRLEKNKI